MSPHFSLDELTFSAYAERHGIDNTPPAKVLANLQRLAFGLERVRELLGQPIHVESGYRSPILNGWVGGSKKSAHMQGYAADFKCPGFGSPLHVCRAIRDSDIEFDQIINEMTWIHLSFDPQNRCECLTKKNAFAPYVKGLV